MDYLILALATWRISSLLVNEDGPWTIFERLRHFIGVRYNADSEKIGTNALSELFTCVWCMSPWIGLLWTIVWSLWPQPVLWIATPLALSAGAIIVDKVTDAN